MKFQNYLMYSQGPLSYDLRHYIAIMAAARHKCMFLVAQQEREFKLQNGQKSWLNGISNIPQKLKDLNEINKLLCHQPWLINHNHIEKVLTGQHNWSLTELIMAITISAHFNALSGFVFGLGINENYMQQLEQEEIFKKKLEAEQAAAQAFKDSRRISLKKKKRNGEKNGFEFPYDTNDNEDYDDEDEYDEDDDEEYIDDNEEERQSYDDLNWTHRSRQFNRNDTHARSDSTGTANRTLSNSSTSSCELGIDMLLKEMQMMSEKTNLMKTTSSLLSSSLSQIQSSGSNTITNSPITNLNGQIQYLSDLSNYKSFHNNYNHNHHLTSHNHNLQYRNHDNEQCENENTNLNTSNATNHIGTANASHFDEIESELDESEIDEHESDSNNNRLKSLNKINKLKSKSITKLNSSLLPSIQSAAINNNNNKQHQPVTCTNINTHSNNHNLITNHSSIMTSVINQSNKHMLKFTYEPDFAYLNFKKADQSLKLEYYTWENQGYITAFSIYPDICELLDKNFKIAVNMTYNTMGSHKDVDTSLFRRAVWHYIHSLFGIHYDDYDYNQIKVLLASPLRTYIKILCSCPERITKKHYDSIMKEFTHSEKVHINIVIMQARIQASMLYFLRALSSYFA